MDKKISYKISNNKDWADMKESELLVDISNDSYFGFRAMQKKAQQIIYNPSLINDLIRISKESKKFPDTKHIFILDPSTLCFGSGDNIELFIKSCSKQIEEILKINPLMKFSLELMIKDIWKKTSLDILYKIFKE